MPWLIALVIVFLLAVLPLGASAIYDSSGFVLRLIAGPLKIQLLPGKKKEKPEKQQEKKEKPKPKADKPAKPKEKTEEKPKQENKSGGKLTDFLPLVKVALDFLGDFRRKLRVNVLEMKLVMAGDDPCDLATNYGKAWAALGNLWPQLEKFFVIKKRDVQLECDFTASQTVIYARLDLTITLGRLLSAVAVLGFRAVREYLKIMKTRKGGASI